MNLYVQIAIYSSAYKAKTIADIKKAWQDGKDFRIHAGPYCSIRDSESLKNDGYTTVVIIHANKKVIIHI